MPVLVTKDIGTLTCVFCTHFKKVTTLRIPFLKRAPWQLLASWMTGRGSQNPGRDQDRYSPRGMPFSSLTSITARPTSFTLVPFPAFSSPTNDAITLWIRQWINPLTRSPAPESKNLRIVHYFALEPQPPNPQTWGCVWLISYSSHSWGEG